MPQPPVFSKVPASADFPAVERAILALWDRLDAFQESNRRRKGGPAAPGPEFSFYDGPPFATGTPHYGHLLAGTIKDIIPRYWSMRGYHVERRFGWDCHGLPIESLAQDKLGWNGAPEIRANGVDVFNETCRSMVQTYVAEWRSTVTRMGRWVDFDRDYKTMDPGFMESVWWVFKRLWDLGRVYKAHRIMPYSWKLTTPLANFEIQDTYKDVQDPAITLRFRLKDDLGLGRPVEVLAWTTTPWTLPANLGLAVGPDIAYVVVEVDGELRLLARERLAAYGWDKSPVLASFTGAQLAGKTYAPLFPYFKDHANGFRIHADAFVSTTDGTGIVHLAPAYGEDDYRVCRAAGVAIVDPLDEEAKFTAAVPDWAGVQCKEADKGIIRALKESGRLLKQDTLVHSYPFCPRTDTPLIYRAIDAWYVRVEDLRERMLAANAQVRWVPDFVGSGRFGNWLANARDWNISRNRFWGSCLPVWVAEDGTQICVGSVAELEQLSGVRVTDLHKHHLDQVTFTKDGKRFKRVPEVLDCWFESGSMPYAQQHYPFENQAKVEATFPAHFIAEGLDQTRGWFYTLLVLSTALFDRPAFKNVVVNGIILAADGQKMSKRLKNYPDPLLILEKFGADALRTYLINSPVVRAEPMRFKEEGLAEIVRTVVLPFWSSLSFFTTYAAVDGWNPKRDELMGRTTPSAPRALLDRWVLSVLQSLIRDVNTEMEGYRLYTVVPRLVAFIDDLTNWYIRLSRRRFWKSEDDGDKAAAYATLYEVLTTYARVLAPFMPFLTEEVHQRLVRSVDPAAPASIHWCDYPQVDAALIDAGLEQRMAVARSVVALGRRLREDRKLKLRQPLAKLTVAARDAAVRAAVTDLSALIADELNVKAVAVSADEGAFCAIAVKPNFKELRARAGAKLKDIGTALNQWGHAEVARLESGDALNVAGVDLRLADVILQRTPAAGAEVLSDGPVTVVLDPALTPALLREGLANEVTSVLQQARKGAGFEVDDRITVRWDTHDAELAAAIAEHAADLAREVLALRFERVPGLAGDGVQSVEVNGRPLRFGVAKA
jgi:isoleucyl-tRNA synthetase